VNQRLRPMLLPLGFFGGARSVSEVFRMTLADSSGSARFFVRQVLIAVPDKIPSEPRTQRSGVSG